MSVYAPPHTTPSLTLSTPKPGVFKPLDLFSAYQGRCDTFGTLRLRILSILPFSVQLLNVGICYSGTVN